MFERFFRVQGTAGDGAGLGLAIVREVAEQHGARAIVENPASLGTRVTVLFPAAVPEAALR